MCLLFDLFIYFLQMFVYCVQNLFIDMSITTPIVNKFDQNLVF